MPRYEAHENPVIYKVLLYSDNPNLINVLNDELVKRGIYLVVKSWKNGGVESLNDNKSVNTYLKTIYDLSSKKTDFKKLIQETNKLEHKVAFIISSNIANAKKVGKVNNLVVFVSDVTKSTLRSVAVSVSEYILNNIPKVAVLTKRTPQIRVNPKIAALIFSLSFLLFPALASIYIYLNSLVFNFGFFNNMNLDTYSRILTLDTQIKKQVSTINNYYQSVPLLGVLYYDLGEYSKEVYKKSSAQKDAILSINYFNKSLSDVIKNNSISNVFLSPAKVANDDSNLFSLPKRNQQNGLNKAANRLEKFNKDTEVLNVFFNSSAVKYFLIINQGGEAPTATGGTPSNIHLFSLENGRLTLVEKIAFADLNSRFKGKVSGISLIPTEANLSDTQKISNIGDKFRYFKTVFSELYEINISGIITLENNRSDEILNIKNLLLKKSLSINESNNLYDLLEQVIDSGDLLIYFENDNGDILDNDVFSKQLQSSNECFNYKFSVIEMPSSNYNFINGSFKLNGKYDNDNFTLRFTYNNQKAEESYDLLIKSPAEIKSNLAHVQSIDQKILTTKEENILLTNIEGGVDDVLVAEYLIPTESCDNGLGIKLIKQPGNDKLRWSYEINSVSPLYFFFNSSLTGRGNKFYNIELLDFNKNATMVFIK